MDPLVAGYIGIVILVLLLIMGLPVAFTMLVVGFFGHLVLVGVNQSLAGIAVTFYNNMSNYNLTVVPLFIVMGYFAWRSGFADDAFRAASNWVNRIPGGLAQATILAGAAFAAACGTTAASCAALGKVCIPSMKKAGVDERLAIGTVAASAALSVMIPPSVIMPLYAVITEQSTGKLLMAGLIPGIVATVVFMILVYIMVRLRPGLVVKSGQSISWEVRIRSLKNIWGIALLFVIVMGGIYTGVVTPTEAAGAGALGALLIGVASRRLHLKDILYCFEETGKLTAVILIIVVCALYFSHFLAITRLPLTVSAFLVDLVAPRMVIFAALMVFYAILGCILDSISIMLLTMPIIFPAILKLGFDPIWFGVIVVLQVEMGALTPPFGINLFILKGSLPETKMSNIIQGVMPFVYADILLLVLYTIFPQLSLFLPSRM